MSRKKERTNSAMDPSQYIFEDTDSEKDTNGPARGSTALRQRGSDTSSTSSSSLDDGSSSSSSSSTSTFSPRGVATRALHALIGDRKEEGEASEETRRQRGVNNFFRKRGALVFCDSPVFTGLEGALVGGREVDGFERGKFAKRFEDCNQDDDDDEDEEKDDDEDESGAAGMSGGAANAISHNKIKKKSKNGGGSGPVMQSAGAGTTAVNLLYAGHEDPFSLKRTTLAQRAPPLPPRPPLPAATAPPAPTRTKGSETKDKLMKKTKKTKDTSATPPAASSLHQYEEVGTIGGADGGTGDSHRTESRPPPLTLLASSSSSPPSLEAVGAKKDVSPLANSGETTTMTNSISGSGGQSSHAYPPLPPRPVSIFEDGEKDEENDDDNDDDDDDGNQQHQRQRPPNNSEDARAHEEEEEAIHTVTTTAVVCNGGIPPVRSHVYYGENNGVFLSHTEHAEMLARQREAEELRLWVEARETERVRRWQRRFGHRGGIWGAPTTEQQNWHEAYRRKTRQRWGTMEDAKQYRQYIVSVLRYMRRVNVFASAVACGAALIVLIAATLPLSYSSSSNSFDALVLVASNVSSVLSSMALHGNDEQELVVVHANQHQRNVGVVAYVTGTFSAPFFLTLFLVLLITGLAPAAWGVAEGHWKQQKRLQWLLYLERERESREGVAGTTETACSGGGGGVGRSVGSAAAMMDLRRRQFRHESGRYAQAEGVADGASLPLGAQTSQVLCSNPALEGSAGYSLHPEVSLRLNAPSFFWRYDGDHAGHYKGYTHQYGSDGGNISAYDENTDEDDGLAAVYDESEDPHSLYRSPLSNRPAGQARKTAPPRGRSFFSGSAAKYEVDYPLGASISGNNYRQHNGNASVSSVLSNGRHAAQSSFLDGSSTYVGLRKGGRGGGAGAMPVAQSPNQTFILGEGGSSFVGTPGRGGGDSNSQYQGGLYKRGSLTPSFMLTRSPYFREESGPAGGVSYSTRLHRGEPAASVAGSNSGGGGGNYCFYDRSDGDHRAEQREAEWLARQNTVGADNFLTLIFDEFQKWVSEKIFGRTYGRYMSLLFSPRLWCFAVCLAMTVVELALVDDRSPVELFSMGAKEEVWRWIPEKQAWEMVKSSDLDGGATHRALLAVLAVRASLLLLALLLDIFS